MADNVILATIGPADFAVRCPHAALGDTWETCEFVAPKAGIARIGGGDLYVLAVRPDERVWVVARLHAPTHDGACWRAERPNALPMRDITDFVERLWFLGADRVHPADGGLGAQLAKPRVLNPRDHGLLEAIVGGRLDAPPEEPAPPPTTWREAVASMAAWRATPDASRAELLGALCAELGTDFAVASPSIGTEGLGSVTHVPSGTELAVIPGGGFLMGATLDDVRAVRSYTSMTDDRIWLDELGASRPPRPVGVPPFLFARRRAPVPDGLRLPSEAEWEWVAREGGRTRFVGVPPSTQPRPPMGGWTRLMRAVSTENAWGITDLHEERELVADGWAPSHADPPPGVEPRPGGPGVTRWAHYTFQSGTEVVALHAAFRQQASTGRTRPAMSLPGVEPGTAPPVSAGLSETFPAIWGMEDGLRTTQVCRLPVGAGMREPERVALEVLLSDRLGQEPDTSWFGLRVLADALSGGATSWASARIRGDCDRSSPCPGTRRPSSTPSAGETSSPRSSPLSSPVGPNASSRPGRCRSSRTGSSPWPSAVGWTSSERCSAGSSPATRAPGSGGPSRSGD